MLKTVRGVRSENCLSVSMMRHSHGMEVDKYQAVKEELEEIVLSCVLVMLIHGLYEMDDELEWKKTSPIRISQAAWTSVRLVSFSFLAEARAFRRKLMRRPIALRGDTKLISPHMLGTIVHPYVQDVPGPQVAGLRQLLHEKHSATAGVIHWECGCLARAVSRNYRQKLGCWYYSVLLCSAGSVMACACS